MNNNSGDLIIQWLAALFLVIMLVLPFVGFTYPQNDKYFEKFREEEQKKKRIKIEEEEERKRLKIKAEEEEKRLKREAEEAQQKARQNAQLREEQESFRIKAEKAEAERIRTQSQIWVNE